MVETGVFIGHKQIKRIAETYDTERDDGSNCKGGHDEKNRRLDCASEIRERESLAT